jgi:hypothetical protein
MMSVETLPKLPVAADGTCHPFEHDMDNRGTKLGSNVLVMHRNFDNCFCSFLIVVDKNTGERIKITFPR